MAPAVTVVVPVYNPGRYIDGCIRSLLAQSLPAGAVEALFVDDGSTDATPGRLAELAAEHPQIRVITQENSGWPGKPRNVGMDHATGDYVQFLDQDDELGPEALARMLAVGSRNDADIVLGKVASDFRGVPHGVFRENVERCTIYDAPLIDSLTPHKMFRRAFLDEHSFRYPEGKRRLEDQLFMVRTYLAAKAVSIVGDYPCYFYKKRSDGRNAGSTRIQPAGYYGNLREVLAVIEAATEPGEFRNSLLRRFYRVELLGRLSEPSMLTYDDGFRGELFAEVRRLAAERFPAEVARGLRPVPRGRSTLLRDGRLADLVELARRCASVTNSACLEHLQWRDGVLHATLRTELRYGDGGPLVVTGPADAPVLDDRLVGGLIDPAGADLEAELAASTAEVVIRHRNTAVEWSVPAQLAAARPANGSGERRIAFAGTARLDPQTLAGGNPLERGAWDVSVRISALGLVKRTRLGAQREPAADRGAVPAVLGNPARAVLPYFTVPHGNLSLDVDEHGKSLVKELTGRGVPRARVDAGTVTAPLPVITTSGSGELPAHVILTSGGARSSRAQLPARIVPTGGAAELRASISTGLPGPVAGLRRGNYRLLLGTERTKWPPVRVGWVRVARGAARRVTVDGPVADRLPAALLALARRMLRILPPAASARVADAGRRALRRAGR